MIQEDLSNVNNKAAHTLFNADLLPFKLILIGSVWWAIFAGTRSDSLPYNFVLKDISLHVVYSIVLTCFGKNESLV